MGCDIHIVIQRQEANGDWREIVWQDKPWCDDKPIDGIPVAPDAFDGRNYDTFAILANVRNGIGFAGIKMGEGWPSIAPDRGFPDGFHEESVAPRPEYPEYGPRSLGDHSFTWMTLDELQAFDWDGTMSWLYGCVPAKEYERLSAANERPHTYSGGISGPGICVYEPDDYKAAKANRTLAPKSYVRMGWAISAADATKWPAEVLPWLESLADGRPLRLVMGFDS